MDGKSAFYVQGSINGPKSHQNALQAHLFPLGAYNSRFIAQRRVISGSGCMGL